MKKDKRILALVLAAAMMGTTALPVWAQTPETTDSNVVEVEGTLENIIAAVKHWLRGLQRCRRITTTFMRRRTWWIAWPIP